VKDIVQSIPFHRYLTFDIYSLQQFNLVKLLR
jgi:hypothetical protein